MKSSFNTDTSVHACTQLDIRTFKQNISTTVLCIGIPFMPVFPGWFPFYEPYTALSQWSTKFSLGCQIICVFQGHKNTTFLIMYMNILTFSQWEKISVGVAEP